MECSLGQYYKFFTCKQCQSQRVYYKEVDIEIELPQSVEDGYKIVLPGQSHRSINAKNGDLNIYIKVEKHFLFTREPSTFNIAMELKMNVHETITRNKFIITGIDGQQYSIGKSKYQTLMPNTW
jgi:DnaJ-class molecular chaperone